VELTYERARELCRQALGDAPLFAVLWGLWLFHKVRSRLVKARELAGQLYALAKHARDPALLLQTHQAQAVTSLCLGDPVATRWHMEQALSLYDPRRHFTHTFHYGQDPGVACQAFGAVALWLLGEPGEAVRRSAEAVRLARELSQPSTLALALHFAAMLHQYRRDAAAVLRATEEVIELATEHGFSFWLAGSTVLRGWAVAELGAVEVGIDQMRQGLAFWEATGSVTYRTYYLGLLAETLGKDGKTQDAVAVLHEALALVEQTSERLHEAELRRLVHRFTTNTRELGRTHAEEADRPLQPGHHP
jgi:adenylate cyclase